LGALGNFVVSGQQNVETQSVDLVTYRTDPFKPAEAMIPNSLPGAPKSPEADDCSGHLSTAREAAGPASPG
jgi:hypothetical protein